MYMYMDFVHCPGFLIFDPRCLGNGFCFHLQVERVWREFYFVLLQDTSSLKHTVLPHRYICSEAHCCAIRCIYFQNNMLCPKIHLLLKAVLCPKIHLHSNALFCPRYAYSQAHSCAPRHICSHTAVPHDIPTLKRSVVPQDTYALKCSVVPEIHTLANTPLCLMIHYSHSIVLLGRSTFKLYSNRLVDRTFLRSRAELYTFWVPRQSCSQTLGFSPKLLGPLVQLLSDSGFKNLWVKQCSIVLVSCVPEDGFETQLLNAVDLMLKH
jgi:hypothetical protein